MTGYRPRLERLRILRLMRHAPVTGWSASLVGTKMRPTRHLDVSVLKPLCDNGLVERLHHAPGATPKFRITPKGRALLQERDRLSHVEA